MPKRPVKNIVRRKTVQSGVKPCVTRRRAQRRLAGFGRLAKTASLAEVFQLLLAQLASQQHAKPRVVAQQNLLPQQQMPHLSLQRPDRRHAVVDQIVDGRAAREPAALAEPVLLPIRRHVERELHRGNRRDHAEIVLAAIDDRQRRRRRANALFGFVRHGVLRSHDDVNEHVRLFKTQPLRGFDADPFQSLLLFFGKIDRPLAPLDPRRKTVFVTRLPLLSSGFLTGLQTTQQLLVRRLVGLRLRRDDLLLLGARRFVREGNCI